MTKAISVPLRCLADPWHGGDQLSLTHSVKGQPVKGLYSAFQRPFKKPLKGWPYKGLENLYKACQAFSRLLEECQETYGDVVWPVQVPGKLWRILGVRHDKEWLEMS